MNKNQIKGDSKIVAGKIQEKVGRLTGNKEQQLKGENRKIAGRTQKAMGNIQKATDDLAEDLANK
jgi:uncharacterized protein YjbJ (UPF0337 family)